ncbi:hypothetical protein GCM10010129_84550 [Streptomyces fumigatiscleroticus]|nr:hypothetical protein GCM10010129_84550 [Streptomyces fumigatiscleroticus]
MESWLAGPAANLLCHDWVQGFLEESLSHLAEKINYFVLPTVGRYAKLRYFSPKV